jgi:hypothetical protein
MNKDESNLDEVTHLPDPSGAVILPANDLSCETAQQLLGIFKDTGVADTEVAFGLVIHFTQSEAHEPGCTIDEAHLEKLRDIAFKTTPA